MKKQHDGPVDNMCRAQGLMGRVTRRSDGKLGPKTRKRLAGFGENYSKKMQSKEGQR